MKQVLMLVCYTNLWLELFISFVEASIISVCQEKNRHVVLVFVTGLNLDGFSALENVDSAQAGQYCCYRHAMVVATILG